MIENVRSAVAARLFPSLVSAKTITRRSALADVKNVPVGLIPKSEQIVCGNIGPIIRDRRDKATCARCDQPHVPGHALCRDHKNAYQREWARARTAELRELKERIGV